MKHNLLRSLGVGVAVAAFAAVPAQAVAKKADSTTTSSGTTTTSVDTSSCTAPTLYQPFRAWNDTNWYAMAPGEAADDFYGTGWTLTAGAQIVSTTLEDGTSGEVLDLPRGSQAVSPYICLTADYPTSRMMFRNVSGSNGGSVGFSVSYAGTSSADDPVQTGTFKTTGSPGAESGWMLSDPESLDPGSSPGWQLMQITLTANGPKEFQVYNHYNDPKGRE